MDADAEVGSKHESNPELAKFQTWSYVSIEGHASNVVIRKKSNHSLEDPNESPVASISSMKSVTSLVTADSEPLSLLDIIDDKNKEIATLKRQHFNQKLQLNHYLRHGLENDAITDYSKSVNLAVPEENDTINLAMARFNKVNNRKSRMLRIYDKINSTDLRICNLLKKQESLLRKVTMDILTTNRNNCMLQAQKVAVSSTAADQPASDQPDPNFISYAAQLDMFSRLLSSTISVKRELEFMKNFSERLVSVEEERNSLVDHIFQLPVEQRLNGCYLLSVEREKAKLCLEMSHIRKDQKILRERINQLSHDDELLRQTACELKAKSEVPHLGQHIDNMLKIVESEAISLVTITKEDKIRYEQEIDRLKSSNGELMYQLQSLNEFKTLRDDAEQKILALESHCSELQAVLADAGRKSDEKDEELLRMFKLQIDYDDLFNTTEDLKMKLEDVRGLESEVKELRDKCLEVDILRAERDVLKTEVTNLQMVRHSFMTICERCPKTDPNMDEHAYLTQLCDQIVKIKEMETESGNLKNRMNMLKATAEQQEKQITYLLSIITALETEEAPQSKQQQQQPVCYVQATEHGSATEGGVHVGKWQQRPSSSSSSSAAATRVHANGPTTPDRGAEFYSQDSFQNADGGGTVGSGRSRSPASGRTTLPPPAADKTTDGHKLVAEFARMGLTREMVQMVFGTNDVARISKIIETSELISKLSNNMDYTDTYGCGLAATSLLLPPATDRSQFSLQAGRSRTRSDRSPARRAPSPAKSTTPPSLTELKLDSYSSEVVQLSTAAAQLAQQGGNSRKLISKLPVRQSSSNSLWIVGKEPSSSGTEEADPDQEPPQTFTSPKASSEKTFPSKTLYAATYADAAGFPRSRDDCPKEADRSEKLVKRLTKTQRDATTGGGGGGGRHYEVADGLITCGLLDPKLQQQQQQQLQQQSSVTSEAPDKWSYHGNTGPQADFERSHKPADGDGGAAPGSPAANRRVTDELLKIRNDISKTMAQPGGRASIVANLKNVYKSFFGEHNAAVLE